MIEMVIATHLIKIKGTFDERWTEKKIKRFIDEKINNEIDKIYHADLENFQINGSKIEVWVFISAFSFEATEEIVEKWLKDHIHIKEGITIQSFAIKEIIKLGSKKPGIRIII